MANKYTIAAFDFDGTITKKDSLIDFIIYVFGYRKFLKGIIRLLPSLLLCKLGYSCDKAKKDFFSLFFKGFKEDKFNLLCRDYSLNKLKMIIRQQALKKINHHKHEGHKLVIVSASIKNWIKPWAEKNLFDEVIATQVEVENGTLTGRFKTKNCRGQEKLRRFLEKYPRREEYFLYFYSNSRIDNPMLSFADSAFPKGF